ncbi:MAG: ABC transporter permease [Thermodesulfobacteriota bacterium]|nr:ABC transporter permease [Thermodesulfobacteriota bacterium]
MKTVRIEQNTKITILRVLIALSLFLAWEIGTRLETLDKFFFSSPSEIGRDVFDLFITGKVYPHIAMTMTEVFAGLLFGSITGIFAGILLGKYETLAGAMDPVIMGLYAIPKIAIAPLFILWFGLGIIGKIVFAWVVVFFLIFFNTYAGMRNVDPELIDSVKAMGGNEWHILTKVSIPSSIPWILVGLRASLGSSVIAAIVGEFVAADIGLGHLIMEGLTLFMTQRVLAVVLLLSIIVITMDICLRKIEKRFLRWRPGRIT